NMNSSIFISPSQEHAILTGQEYIFILSSILNLISLICLLRESPPNQATIRNNLVLIQIFIIIGDVYRNILFQPIPLFPLAAAYCRGVLCTRIIPVAFITNGMVWLILMNLCLTIFCCLFRHQILLPPKHRAKLSVILIITPFLLLSLFAHMFQLLQA
ncbi:hypothetical protein PMAYCL1PPCAC_31442, partial [Pristionchus mayeri]